MKRFTRGSSLVLLSGCLVALAGCTEDNEAAIKQQASRAKGTIPGSRTAQARTQEEYFEITPGVRGAGLTSGVRPDQGSGYPGAQKDSPQVAPGVRKDSPPVAPGVRKDSAPVAPGVKKDSPPVPPRGRSNH